MYCTYCGADEQNSKAYCRLCGKWIGGSAPEARLTVMIVFNALSALFGAASAFALFSNLSTSAEWPKSLAGTFCLIISVYQTVSFFFALSLRLRMKQGQGKAVGELESARKVSALRAAEASDFINVTSVTENTTELLERKTK